MQYQLRGAEGSKVARTLSCLGIRCQHDVFGTLQREKLTSKLRSVPTTVVQKSANLVKKRLVRRLTTTTTNVLVVPDLFWFASVRQVTQRKTLHNILGFSSSSSSSRVEVFLRMTVLRNPAACVHRKHGLLRGFKRPPTKKPGGQLLHENVGALIHQFFCRPAGRPIK